jgi:gamma-D-glutamyl-L-lysine dipeptidyl-peptidase
MHKYLSLTLLAVLFMVGCSGPRSPDPVADLIGAASPPLRDMGYAVQVGAFASIDNAVRLESILSRRGIDAFYFLDGGLYKVRFGNHGSYPAARSQAESLQAQGLIADFFIVSPENYASAQIRGSGHGDLRAELVRTARSFLDVPYRWGGTTAESGFDCSGLTLVCYRLNGLDLPRVSYSQFAAGRPISRSQLQKGDLVFFATRGGHQVSHVGLYIGDGRFIHAPRSGQSVRIESLSNSYYQRTFVGARSYL